MNILAATRNLAFVTKLFVTAGISNLQEMIAAGDETALKAYIEAQTAPAAKVDNVAIESAFLTAAGITVKEGQSPAEALKAALAAKDAQCSVYVEGLNLSGINVAMADAKAGLTATDVSKSVSDRVSVKAGELTAKIGTKPLETEITNDPNKPNSKTEGLTGLARTVAAFKAEAKK